MTGSDEREARLVLDVLELDPVGAPDEDGERVGGVDDVGDLEPARPRLALDVGGAVDEERQMVEERPVDLGRSTAVDDELLAGDPEVVAVALEPELLESDDGRVGLGTRTTTWSRSLTPSPAGTRPSAASTRTSRSERAAAGARYRRARSASFSSRSSDPASASASIAVARRRASARRGGRSDRYR